MELYLKRFMVTFVIMFFTAEDFIFIKKLHLL